MVLAMLLAHLVGDFILQWDRLALWKSRELKGVVFHGTVIWLVTWVFALPFGPEWWWGVLLIGITHFLIDVTQLYVKFPIPALLRFVLDQFFHLLFIFMALVWGGYLNPATLGADLMNSINARPYLAALLGYAFITMPTWVLLKFTIYGLVKGSPPNFPEGPNKFVGILERILITTLIAFGQFLLIPLVALPRLILDWPRVVKSGREPIYASELIASVSLAVVVGFGLRLLVF
jgi:hypothetical protein